jgi:hypothetical protein
VRAHGAADGAFKDELRVPLLTLGILASYEVSERDYEGIEIPRMGEQGGAGDES